MRESQTNVASDVLLDVDMGTGPLHKRVERALRSAIRSGRLRPGSALPPSRALAKDLGCSRWAVTEAYSQLLAEGYLEARAGSGTRVRWVGDDHATAPLTPRAGTGPDIRYDMAPGLPDLRAFPRSKWAEAVKHAALSAPVDDLTYGSPSGHVELRRCLEEYLQRSRAASISDAAVLVTTGTTSGVTRLCAALARAGHTSVAVEDPGWTTLARGARAAGLTPVPVPVDADGIRVDELARLASTRAVLVTPAHQFPRGVVLSPARRSALLAWARAVDGVILEDDYDAEYRFDRRPIGSLQGMEPTRVALLGSLSKTLSPSLRIGWMLLPQQWRHAVESLEVAAAVPATLDQLAFAQLLREGAYDRHLRRTRRTLRRRRDVLVAELARQLPECRVSGVAAGLHLTLWLPRRCTGSSVVQAAQRGGLRVADLDSYRSSDAGAPAIVLSYANLAVTRIPEAVEVLAEAL